MENKKERVQLSDEAMDMVVGGVYINSKIVKNKDTGETYKLLTDPMTAFSYATKHGKESESDIIAGMMAKGYIQ